MQYTIDILFYVSKAYLIDCSSSISIEMKVVKAEGAMLWKCPSIFTCTFILCDDLGEGSLWQT